MTSPERKCQACNKEIEENQWTTIFNFGSVHSNKDCVKIAHEANRKRISDTENLQIDDLPNLIDLYNFERISLKCAIEVCKWFRMCKADPTHESHEDAQKIEPLFMFPQHYVEEVKERVIQHLPEWVETKEARGHERIFRGGTYWFKEDIPKESVLQAFIQAGYSPLCQEQNS